MKQYADFDFFLNTWIISEGKYDMTSIKIEAEGETQATTWTGCQSVTGQTQWTIYTYSPF